MKRILITYDGSAGALSAIEELRDAGLPQNAEARVIAVSDAWAPPPSSDEELPAFMRENRQQARERSAQALQLAEQIAGDGARAVRERFPNWQTTPIGRVDSPAWAILTEIRSWRPSIVAAGAQSHSTLERLFLGSVSQKIVSDAECSVRISRPRRDRSANIRVIIAFDGSPDSRAAVAEASGRAWPPGTQIRFITVRQDELAALAPARHPSAAAGTAPQDWLEEALADAVRLFCAKGLDAEFTVEEGDIRRRILKMADDWAADIIFVGACGWRHQGRWRVGSVPTALAQRAPCTVEIIRPQGVANDSRPPEQPR